MTEARVSVSVVSSLILHGELCAILFLSSLIITEARVSVQAAVSL
jgi:hypothetical protein